MQRPLIRALEPQREPTMKLFFRISKTVIRRASTKFMDKVGSKIVARMTDTSSDAPNAFYEPKRDHAAESQQSPSQ